MVVKNPKQAAGVERLKRWGSSPAGGGKVIAWGTDGDFERCRAFYKDKLPARMLDGWCAELHKRATGATPGHAPAELAAKKAEGK